MADTEFNVVAKELVGDSWPVNHPGADPVLYGHFSLEPKGAFEARSLQTFKLVYTVGRYGIDDTGSIRVVFRFMGDWEPCSLKIQAITILFQLKPTLVPGFH